MSQAADVREELAELRERVETLEAIVAAEDAPGSRDRYDRQVISNLAEADDSVPVGTIQRWYRRAGVRNKRKIRNRIKALAEDGLIESVGTAHWRYVAGEGAGESYR